ncbi:inactive pancreatic lipase-related protein 1-like [Macrosteles quadrilineatus]|uniref:inactive pancreatic lipase-related protein 1-like n=1 Tax=Macrosteles quadrilineatus TaxID=74068 RepID=UPI0023E31961|nr:inactive pancreatic lipase-related protein 1-like [Macrosteles quadrilineatus]
MILLITHVVLCAAFVNTVMISNDILDDSVDKVLEPPPMERCYPGLGCFGLDYPWVSVERPFRRLPDSPLDIGTVFYLSTRTYRNTQRQLVKTEPDISLLGLDWDSRRWTVILTHGFRSSGNISWVRELENTLLDIRDMNVVTCDWSKGSDGLQYIRAAVNSRVVGAQVARFISYLLENKLAVVDRIHLIGHSLGAHALSYVSAKIKNIARLTGLDPAQPGFEGAHPDTRLNPSDAMFVDVIHTNADHFITCLGLGMMTPVGHVDFFVNGGQKQPGCWFNKGILWEHIAALTEAVIEQLADIIGCSHERAWTYYIESLRSNCSFWGKQMTLLKGVLASRCTPQTCQQMGRYTSVFPGRGTFAVTTNARPPFCIKEPLNDYIMTYHRMGLTKPGIEQEKYGGI